MSETLRAGVRLRLSGGYDMEPRWLNGEDSISGTVVGFIPTQNKEPTAVVRLDRPLTIDGITGERLVLKLRYKGESWADCGVVHVELCDFEPEYMALADRKHGLWVESHATYTKLDFDH